MMKKLKYVTLDDIKRVICYNLFIQGIKGENAMLKITKQADGSTLTVKVEGRVDSNTAVELDRALNGSLDGITKLILDFERLKYISSAGLRALLIAQKTMNQQGTIVIRNVSDAVKEIFEVTGFSDMLTIE
jgi:anti-sigma B factor antagonist